MIEMITDTTLVFIDDIPHINVIISVFDNYLYSRSIRKRTEK